MKFNTLIGGASSLTNAAHVMSIQLDWSVVPSNQCLPILLLLTSLLAGAQTDIASFVLFEISGICCCHGKCCVEFRGT